MDDKLLNWLYANKMLVGGIAVLISVVTWSAELMDLVYVCPFCRTQRTLIGLLGILVLLPTMTHWISRWAATVVGLFGFTVGARQHFGGWQNIMAGKFEWGEAWYVNSWMLSGFALFIISGLVLFVWTHRAQVAEEAEEAAEEAPSP